MSNLFWIIAPFAVIAFAAIALLRTKAALDPDVWFLKGDDRRFFGILAAAVWLAFLVLTPDGNRLFEAAPRLTLLWFASFYLLAGYWAMRHYLHDIKVEQARERLRLKIEQDQARFERQQVEYLPPPPPMARQSLIEHKPAAATVLDNQELEFDPARFKK